VLSYALSSDYGWTEMSRNKYHTGGNQVIPASFKRDDNVTRSTRTAFIERKKTRKGNAKRKEKMILVERTRVAPLSHVVDKIKYTMVYFKPSTFAKLHSEPF